MSEAQLEDNWKDKYFKALLAQEDAEKAQGELISQIYAELIRAFGHFRGRDERLDEILAGLPPEPVQNALSISTLKDINRQIGQRHDQLTRPAVDNSQAANQTDALAVAKSTLLSLIEQLPAEISNSLYEEGVDEALENAQEIDHILAVVCKIKDKLYLILEDRAKQIKKLSSFMGNVAKRLDGMKLHLDEEKNDRKASQNDRGDLTKLVGNNLQMIRESVAEADSINTLQRTIESRLDEIDTTVTSFTERESERADKAEKASSELEAQLQRMESETHQLRQSLEAARTEAIIDPLTGVSNRRAYEDRMQIEYSRWKRNHTPLVLAVMDIDHFKKINDNFGHPIGDKVLKVVAGRLQQQVRESDFFGRIGGEEFAFLLVDSTIDNALEKTETLRKSIQECNFRIKKKKFQVTMSIGLAQFKGKDTVQTVYQRADQALVQAKKSGRNQCQSELDLK